MNFIYSIKQRLTCCCFIDLPFNHNPKIKTFEPLADIIKDTYKSNLKTIMDVDSSTMDGCFIANGTRLEYRISKNGLTEEKIQKGIELVSQVVRQAWGQIVDSQIAIGTPPLLEEAIHNVDLLQEKLRRILPSELAEKVLKNDKWPLILANNYKASTSELIKKFNNNSIKEALLERDRKIQEIRNKNSSLFTFQPFTEKDGGINYKGTMWVKKKDDICAISKNGSEEADVNWENSRFAWVNELIGAALDQILGCKFNAAVSALISDPKIGLRTLHAFKKSGGFWEKKFKSNVDLESAQMFVLFNILLKTQDCHRKNILYREENNVYYPIPIDFGRLLSFAPEASIRGLLKFSSFIYWKDLQVPFNPKVQEFIKNLDARYIIQSIGNMFHNHPYLIDSVEKEIEIKLYHLYANIIMVKEAIKMGCTPIHLIALSTFNLSPKHLENLEKMKEDFKNLDSNKLRRQMLEYILANCFSGFLLAWKAAFQNGIFNEKVFTLVIKEAIQKIKKKSVVTTYFNKNALQVYHDLHL